VILTAGTDGSEGAGVSVDYSAAPGLTVVTFQSTSGGALPLALGTTTDTGTRIENINSASFPPFFGTGLSAGQSHQLGTITFNKSGGVGAGAFEIQSDANGPSDGVLDLDGNVITFTTTFNSAFLIQTGTAATPTGIPSATPIPTPTPTVTAIPSPTPTAAATPTPAPTATVNPNPTPTWPPRPPRPARPGPPPVDCLCEIQNINPNQVVLQNVGAGGKGSDRTRKMVMTLNAVDAPGATCDPGELSNRTLVNLRMVDDDGDVLIDRYEWVVCEGGGVTTTVKRDVFFQGPMNCENGAVPLPKPGFSLGAITSTGSAHGTAYYVEDTKIKCFE
jgi:hypothetical protein